MLDDAVPEPDAVRTLEADAVEQELATAVAGALAHTLAVSEEHGEPVALAVTVEHGEAEPRGVAEEHADDDAEALGKVLPDDVVLGNSVAVPVEHAEPHVDCDSVVVAVAVIDPHCESVMLSVPEPQPVAHSEGVELPVAEPALDAHDDTVGLPEPERQLVALAGEEPLPPALADPAVLPVVACDCNDENDVTREAVHDVQPEGDAAPVEHVLAVLVTEENRDAVSPTVAQAVEDDDQDKEAQTEGDGDNVGPPEFVREAELVIDKLLHALLECHPVAHTHAVADCVAHALRLAEGSSEVEAQMDTLEDPVADAHADVDAHSVEKLLGILAPDAQAELVVEGLRDSDGDDDSDKNAVRVDESERGAKMLRLAHAEALRVDTVLGLAISVRCALSVASSDNEAKAVADANTDADAPPCEGEPDTVGQPALPPGEAEGAWDGVTDPEPPTADTLMHWLVLLNTADTE